MKILIFSQYFWPESFRINEVVESLMLLGHEVTVLTGQPNYPQGKIFGGYKSFSVDMQLHPLGYRIYRVPLVPRGSGSAIRLGLNYLSFLAASALLGTWSLRGQRFDLVFVYGASPILQAAAAIWLARLKHAKLVLWVQDLWPQSIEATGYIKSGRVLNLVSRLVSAIYQRCDLLLVQSMPFLTIVQAMAGSTLVKYHPNPGELAFSGARPSESTPAIRLSSKFNVVFAGNLGKAQALPTILEAAEILRSDLTVQFVLVGSGSQSEWLSQEIINRSLPNVSLTGRFEPNQMPGILEQASVLLVSLVKNPIVSHTVPSKIQVYLAAGKPIIAAMNGEGARVVAEAGAGLTCPAEDALALAQAVRELKAMSNSQRTLMGEKGARYYALNFEPNALAEKLQDHFLEVLGRGCEMVD